MLLLGMLLHQSMHGYQLNEFIESHLGMSIQLKKPTAYYLLGKMEKDGWIKYQEEKQGNRPTRRIYSITKMGEEVFDSMLRESIKTYNPIELSGDIYLAFVHRIPLDEVVDLLKVRREKIEQILESIRSVEKHTGLAQLIIDHQQRHLENELKWHDKIIKKIRTARNKD